MATDRQTNRRTDEQHRCTKPLIKMYIIKATCCCSGGRKPIFKPRFAASANTYTSDFPNDIFRVAAHYTIAEKAIRFHHPDYNPDRAQKLISSSISRHLSTRNISSKSMQAFLSNLANRQTDRQTRANAFTSSFVGGNKHGYKQSYKHRNKRRRPKAIHAGCE